MASKRWTVALLAIFVVLATLADAAGPPGKNAKDPQCGFCPTEKEGRTLVTLRGEVVDYYCYIEKGLTGPAHRECGVKCVAGDVCMGLLTTNGELLMISVNHIRAMTPLAFQNIPDPFRKCTTLISEKVDLTGYAMQRRGQKIIEIVGVKKVGAPG
jgi:hypothetical protein